MTNKQISESEAKSRLSALCAQREHCSYEMIEKMQRWELSEEAQAMIMQYLTEHKFIDDERYARAMSIDKLRYNKWGRKKIEQALWQKHIDSDIITHVLDEIDDDEYLSVLRPLLQSKRHSTKGKTEYEINQKLIRFAFSRGYEYRLIRQCLDDVEEDVYQDD
ncbi:MAG: RecX family transcriptional regulator [Prevotella sp.]|nr:RecX family transcriptional regulator [Prevotella sp.]